LAEKPSSFLTVTGQGSVGLHLPTEKQSTGSTQQGKAQKKPLPKGKGLKLEGHNWEIGLEALGHQCRRDINQTLVSL
jgi:hypothetical protein